MKTNLLIAFILFPAILMAQITTPVVKANFGVDADLRANYFNSVIMAGNDDWFNNGTGGSGAFVIDTAGAAARVARYLTDLPYRRLPFSAGMKYPQFSVVNNRLLYDAYFYRDYHGDDSTMFAAGSNKNGMSPASWSTPVSQSIPDKNEILDIMMHVRRAGPNTTDSLWMMGGVSIENTTGNRYFDFEMWQTDLTYNRPTLNFSNYGPDAGHTSWQFDAAGNVTRVGDIIFTAEYSSSSLSLLQARIWVHNSSLAITPVNFSWGGLFDGASMGATYGYASITPKTAGAFYTGMQCVNNTWAGPFNLVIGTNALQPNYIARQYMEFSVNLTKLGLDPVTSILGGNICGLPFKKVLIKSRASTSFTAELKDFIMPFEFFAAPRATVQATVPKFCGPTGSTDIFVTNPLLTSTYTWVTVDGNIVGGNTGTTITADTTGTYVVTQQLLASCPAYAIDTIIITADPLCTTLGCNIIGFGATLNKGITQLNWQAICTQAVSYFEVERSTDGNNFTPVNHVNSNGVLNKAVSYSDRDYLNGVYSPYLYYRLKAVGENGAVKYSQIVKLSLAKIMGPKIRLTPNPVVSSMLASVESATVNTAQISIYSSEGKLLKTQIAALQKGFNIIKVDGFQNWQRGIYHVLINTGGVTYSEKIMVNNK
jgi:hypothetical protein